MIRPVRRTAAALALALAAATLLAPEAPASAVPARQARTYCRTPIQPPDGDRFLASDTGNPVNDRGLVAGNYVTRGTGLASVFDTRTGTFTTVVDGPSTAADVNRRGDVTGNQRTAAGHLLAFFRPGDGGPTVFAENPTDRENVSVEPAAVNDRGLVVGSITGGGRQAEAFVWEPRHSTLPRLLGTLGGNTSDALGVNRAGDVVGSSTTASGATHPFVQRHRSGVMTDLGLLPGAVGARARDINDASYAVGETFSATGVSQAVLWSPRTHRPRALTNTTGNGSIAYAINRRGAVAGQLFTPYSGDFDPVLWPTSHSTAEVLTSPTRFQLASGINRRGLVVAASNFQSTVWRLARRCS